MLTGWSPETARVCQSHMYIPTYEVEEVQVWVGVSVEEAAASQVVLAVIRCAVFSGKLCALSGGNFALAPS